MKTMRSAPRSTLTKLARQLWSEGPQHHASAIRSSLLHFSGIVLPLDNDKTLSARSMEKGLALQLGVYFNYDVQCLPPTFVTLQSMQCYFGHISTERGTKHPNGNQA
ncbi:uncharacterized protein LOC135375153 [Ornithodoros turicata]|uniref:uncharacterized protein LOC135375153 n=1 Tax=Ornithodoros turicata TaxID=34597 RepID=UPI00313A03C8